VGVAAGDPFGVAGFEVGGGWGGVEGRGLWVAAKVESADGYEQVGSGVMVEGDDASGLEFVLGDADCVFDEEDLPGAAGKNVEAAFFVPFGGGVTEGFVVQDFDGYVAEGLGGLIVDAVGERGGGKGGLAVLKFDGYGRLIFDRVEDLGGAEGDGDVVVAVPVHQGFRVRWDLDVEDSDGFVFEGEVVVRLGG